MRVKLTLRRPAAPLTDVVVMADSTATIADVARQIATSDPARSIVAGPADVLTLSVAPPTSEQLTMLNPDLLVGDAPIGSGFLAEVVNVGPNRASAGGAGARPAAVLTVVAGPAAGQEFPLPIGHFLIGRDAANDVTIADPLVSKRHARIEVASTFVELVDLNSANGILVDGGLVQRLRVIPGQTFALGDCEFVVHMVSDFDGSASGDPVLERGGALLFNRSPRVEERFAGEDLDEPRYPRDQVQRLFPWPMLVAPILLGLAIFAMSENPRSLLIVFMSPLMMFGNFISQKTNLGQRLRKEEESFEEQFERLEEKLYHAHPREREVRHNEVPAVAVVFDEAMRLGPLLWTRRPEHWNFLSLRLGVCEDEARTRIKRTETPEALVEYVERVDRLEERYKMIPDVPILESLQSVGSIGVAGPTSLASDALRGIAVQLFGMHSPNELVTVALTEPGWANELDWLKWLPHTSSERSPFKDVSLADSASTGAALLSGLEEIVLRRSREAKSQRPPYGDDWDPMLYGTDVKRAAEDATFPGQTAILVIVTNDAPVDRARLTQILERGADVGVYGLFVAPVVAALPAACRTFVDVSAGLDHATVGTVRSGVGYSDVQVEGVSHAYMTMLAKRLAPVVDSSTVIEDSSDIPNSVSFLSLVGSEVAEDPNAVIDRWRQNNTIIDRSGAPQSRLKKAGNLRAIIGQSQTDAMTLDLRTQGPHALVGGTTGAGKSEFLQAWVLGMAAAHSPDRVTFLFVDYKGGSAFADCVDLPHTVGLVTDLSPHLVRRALTSLRAELHHREHLFNRKKAKDLLELEKRRDPETPPALVLVIDEFAALAGEVPEFVDGVVDIAQRGRSLGIHLIMATQRPAGVIKDNLRANTNLRVALRMADESDSKDVVDDPVAASFPPSLPGRGIAKTGPGRLVPFQSAYAGGWTTDEAQVAEVRVAELRFGSIQTWEAEQAPESDSHDEDLGPNDQKRIVAALVSAAAHASIPAPRRPWLDDLERAVDIRDLPVHGDGRILLGKMDVPERQLQEPAYFHPDKDGSLLVYGTSGSGKSTVLRTLAIAAGFDGARSNVEVYGLDFGSGSLKSLEVLPHVGSIISGDDAERVQRILRSLARVLDDRGKRFSAANASSLTEYREITGKAESRILLLIDGFPQFRGEWESTTARMPFYQTFMRILGEGRPLGVHVIASADRSGSVPTAVSANVSRRVVLRLSDESGYAMLNAPKDVLDERSAPGRAIVDGLETQIATLGGTPNVAEQTKLLDQLAAELRAGGAREVAEIGALPTRLSVRDLPDRIGEFPVLGVAEDTLAPREFDPVGTFVVAGPPLSGKTTALKGIITSMRRLDPEIKLFHFGGRRAQLKGYVDWTRSAVTPEDAKELAKEIAEIAVDETVPVRMLIVVEDVPQFADGPAEREMKALFQAINRSDHLLVGDADVTQVTSGFGFIGDFKAGRKGIILKPDAFDGDAIFKVPFPKVKRTDFPDGRGIFVQAGRQVTVQLPLIEGDTWTPVR
ncbi:MULTISPECIES: FtsK/SpoIIIE domain-containing protein [unclassified Microbacterium]|jgi:S-DNA-T family DNA segregation ATPase FtsK/SpoIIIE|uniref:FtsK/SpoIIIE domain-containing protein n=1 Tax=unclassified Microbacterium TaxID=2609290 RepID=UPI000CFC1402|nr:MULTISPECIES: FtsK/SpoIIIE domain-containing protein [unclassified Microbacterium]PQZ48666.1 phosphopeptide-binding protein [Microbacterium sp. MYb43]PQZ70215.1 phosphopeptide-binding protein [Microbacterium sp. MYb40]PRB19659.1 phosphopeptide-binding protein [Microbacterium sp. MYb54]PRB23345.1 phosphopeptide-binding protein [Microbacterium sp. MYb50]PRB61577.1 phosphopeptide-binding protein [Microbacterium sp. MYb24]